MRGVAASDTNGAIAQLMPDESHLLSMLADEVAASLMSLSPMSIGRIREEARLRPARWSSALRRRFETDPVAAELLASTGDANDAAVMRTAAANKKWLRPLAAQLTRRVAVRARLHDLGRVGLEVNGAALRRPLRRKVLALLCLLATRPGLAVTRDEAIEAIWPDLGPDTAVNSLHQTIYFLRRVFEPDYKEGYSAGYIAFDGEVLQLDPELVDIDSRRAWGLIDRARSGASEAVLELVEIYRGSFALDFAYEEWASGYRENLHAAILAVAEAAIRSALVRGDVDTAIAVGQKILATDPHADAIELELLRAYKAGGRQAAAAEQYVHYSSYLRSELGAEPPPYADI
jgi:DNA-binding SARP family transcriptional activator